MKLAKRILFGVILLIIIFSAAALFVPNQYGVSRSIIINASSDKIYPLIASPKEWKKWAIWNLRDPNMEILYSGPESGPGAAWEWKSKGEGNGGMKFTQAAPNQALNYEMHLDAMKKPSNGTLLLEAQGGSTKITWSMTGSSEGDFGTKLFVPFMDKLVGGDFETGLNNLKVLAEKN